MTRSVYTVRLGPGLRARLRALAAGRPITVSVIARVALARGLTILEQDPSRLLGSLEDRPPPRNTT